MGTFKNEVIKYYVHQTETVIQLWEKSLSISLKMSCEAIYTNR